ncbi:hypothetical protein PPSIR1_04773 [Plesiocystis pacifica SIR-1]|uniref:MOSC domain-containing protein n=1 Tax=Plesiocystis pacifica SIR-1 TaxID=391625 RepID=A6FWS7_9BACT|nr:hypothetical protein PPSIR1_04773 [Plesiocystis pacifica SIR-1]
MDVSDLDPSKRELLESVPVDYPTERLRFSGPRGDARHHLDRETLVERLRALPRAPTELGTLDHIVARTPEHERVSLHTAHLGVTTGLEGDRWATEPKYGREYQLATTRTDFARTIANGQPHELHGDNLFVSLDLSKANLPVGSAVRMGEVLLEVTPKPHNGCKKWVQRFGLAAMRLNLDPAFAEQHLRGIYFCVVEEGTVRVGDPVRVVRRGPEP